MEKYNYNIASVEKTFKIIDVMVEKNGEMSITQIANAVDASISSVNRFLITMVETGYVDKNSSNNKYFLTNKFLILSNKILTQNFIVKKYVPLANYVSNKYEVTVNLNSIYDNKIFLLYKDTKFYSKDVDFNFGDSIPAYCSSAGKVIIAEYSEEKLKIYFEETNIIKFQKNTLSSEYEIRNSLKEAKEKGFAINDGEYAAGIFTLSFPLKESGKVTGAITLITTTSDKNKIYNASTVNEIKSKI